MPDEPGLLDTDRADAGLIDTDPLAVETEVGTLFPKVSTAALPELPPAGYTLHAVIGRGGMGEVIAGRDQRIGRDVAIKRMRTARPSGEEVARFLREARIQARLDHPAIVPVHELGYDDDGRPYFTMKRLAGTTMAEVLARPAGLAAGAETRRLLRAFVDVCLAIDLAHAREVVHRDLKPANIMLGDYGEVYVLDWGVARVLGEQRDSFRDIDSLDGHAGDDGPAATQAGAVLGTPGYMAPEQARGDRVGTPADVYALGAILFEILAGESLHPRIATHAIASTLGVAVTGPAARAPAREVPPELDAACTAALAADPARRPTARALGDAVQHYLDGDRDVERRRALARDQLAAARAALDAGDPSRRAEGARAAGRALALDPESVEAAELVTALLVEPPAEMPADLHATLERGEADQTRRRARHAAVGFALLLLLTGFLPWLEVASWPQLGAVYLAVLASVALAVVAMRTGRAHPAWVLAAGVVLALALSRLAGPFVLVPALLCGSLLSVTAIPWVNDRRWSAIAFAVTATMAPLVLEWLGVLPSTSGVRDGAFVMTSSIFHTRGAIDFAALTVANLVFVVVVTVFAHAIIRDRRMAQRRLQMQAWHLRQMIPDRADDPKLAEPPPQPGVGLRSHSPSVVSSGTSVGLSKSIR